jgi:hypothetical protein
VCRPITSIIVDGMSYPYSDFQISKFHYISVFVMWVHRHYKTSYKMSFLRYGAGAAVKNIIIIVYFAMKFSFVLCFLCLSAPVPHSIIPHPYTPPPLYHMHTVSSVFTSSLFIFSHIGTSCSVFCFPVHTLFLFNWFSFVLSLQCKPYFFHWYFFSVSVLIHLS